jgi:hypothetical protein
MSAKGNCTERIGMLPNAPMTVSEALILAEEMRGDAEHSAKRLFGRDLALSVLAAEVRRLQVGKA